MTSLDRLKRIFADITLVTLITQTAACGEDAIDRTGFEVTSCDISEQLTAFEPAEPVDALLLRAASLDVSPLPGVPSLLGSFGTLCEGASSDACDEALVALDPSADPVGEYSGFEGRWVEQLVWSRGDDLGVVSNAALPAFLGDIDSVAEAAFIARYHAEHDLVCDGANARTTSDGIELVTTTGFACGRGTKRYEHVLLVRPDGTTEVQRSVVVEVGDPNCVIGRLTDGVSTRPERAPDPRDLGAYLTRMASLEAAAVVAFERLADELAAFGAPPSLVARARASAEDETRHAREVSALAEAFGGVAAPPVGDVSLPRRALFEVALENAREGCVRETYGALVATHQARTATDSRARDVLTRIANDETGHAALSWDVAAWLDTRLDEGERASVRAARDEAVASFRDALAPELTERARALLGLPDAATSRAMFDALAARVWA